MKETTYDKGNMSEAIVMAAYLEAGFTVSVPFGSGAPYDLIVDTGARLCKIQVKTGWLRKGCIIYKGQRRIREAHPYATRPYTEAEVDYFVIYYPAGKSLYAVPSRTRCGDGCLRITPVLNGQAKLVRWAKDYVWEQHLQELKTNSAGSPAISTGA